MNVGLRLTPFDSEGAFFSGLDAKAGVSRLAVRGAGATVFAQGMALAIQVIATVVLARLLVPRDFGLVTMVTTFSLLLVNFGLNGITEAVVQRNEIDDALASNLFWINVGGGLLLSGLFAAAGTLMARFYHEPLVAKIAAGVSFTIFFTSLSVQHSALLKRAMRFSAVSVNDIIARGVSVASSIILAWMGFGYWALVVGAIAQPVATSIGAWFLCDWTPHLPRRAPGTVSALRFAIHVYGRFSINYFGRNLDNLLLGWKFHAVSLGFYKKAYDLFALSGSQLVSPLTIVAVSALRRFDPRSPEYRRYLLNAMSVTALVSMAVGAVLTLVGKDLIRVLLGPKWDAAGIIFTYFGPGIGVMLLYYTQGWIYLSTGRADRWLRWGVFEFIFTALMFAAVLPWGADGIAAAWTASFWILVVPGFWYAGRPIQLGVTTMLSAVWRSVVASLLASGATLLLLREITFSYPEGSTMYALLRIVTISAIFSVLYIVSVILLHGGLAPLLQVAHLVRDMIPWDKGERAAPEAGMGVDHGQLPGLAFKDGRPKPLVSILIPAHNAERWIADTIRSAVAQIWESKEIIVVDDGSADKTLAVARQFESDIVHVATQKNQGAAAARNHALSLSKGEYIQWLDADDILAPDKVARQMEVMEQCTSKKILLSSAWGQFMHRPYRANFVPSALWCDLSPVDWLLRKMGQNLYMQTATWLVHRELSESVGPWDTRLLSDDDGEYFCRVLLASDGVRFVPASKVYYRGPGLAFRSLSFIGHSDWKIKAHWVSMQLHINYLRSLEESERVRAACLRYLQASLGYFYPDQDEILVQVYRLAEELGGKLYPPTLSWKYHWMKALFGWRVAKQGQLLFLRLRWSAHRIIDETAYRFHCMTAAITGRPTSGLVPIGVAGSGGTASSNSEEVETRIIPTPKIEEKISGA